MSSASPVAVSARLNSERSRWADREYGSDVVRGVTRRRGTGQERGDAHDGEDDRAGGEDAADRHRVVLGGWGLQSRIRWCCSACWERS
jgi:hypothetical protein